MTVATIRRGFGSDRFAPCANRSPVETAARATISSAASALSAVIRLLSVDEVAGDAGEDHDHGEDRVVGGLDGWRPAALTRHVIREWLERRLELLDRPRQVYLTHIQATFRADLLPKLVRLLVP